MKHIFLNLKRFDIPTDYHGINSIAPIEKWGSHIITEIQTPLRECRKENLDFTVFFPEAHLIPALNALEKDSGIQIGCQGVYREDTAAGANFGAFTTNRTATAMKALGCTSTIIGHCEERKALTGVLAEAGVRDPAAINRILNQEVIAATNAGLTVLYCIGEAADERENRNKILENQITTGLNGTDRSKIILAYEPVWAIGPGKTPPDREMIAGVGRYVKEITDGMEVVYGGGLKKENARMLSGISSMDGGLIALTRFQGNIGFYPEEYLDIIRLFSGTEKGALK